jgi:hypothetical protein
MHPGGRRGLRYTIGCMRREGEHVRPPRAVRLAGHAFWRGRCFVPPAARPAGARPGANSTTVFCTQALDLEVTFKQNEAGRTTGLVLRQNGIDVEARRVD